MPVSARFSNFGHFLGPQVHQAPQSKWSCQSGGSEEFSRASSQRCTRTLPEEVLVCESSNQRFAREAVSRTSLIGGLGCVLVYDCSTMLSYFSSSRVLEYSNYAIMIMYPWQY